MAALSSKDGISQQTSADLESLKTRCPTKNAIKNAIIMPSQVLSQFEALIEVATRGDQTEVKVDLLAAG